MVEASIAKQRRGVVHHRSCLYSRAARADTRDRSPSTPTTSTLSTPLSPEEQPRAFALLLIQHIWQSSPCEPALRHVRAYTDSQTIPSQLKRLADHLATRANSLSLPPLSFPLPTCFSNVNAAKLDTFHEPFPSLNCFDKVSALAYP